MGTALVKGESQEPVPTPAQKAPKDSGGRGKAEARQATQCPGGVRQRNAAFHIKGDPTGPARRNQAHWERRGFF